jgi:hypothetical protein
MQQGELLHNPLKESLWVTAHSVHTATHLHFKQAQTSAE